MSEAREQLVRELSEKQAVEGLDPETRIVIGLLTETVQTLGEEIDDLQQRVAELEEGGETDEERTRREWYSER